MKKNINKTKKYEKKEVLQVIDGIYDLVGSLSFQQKIQRFRKILNIEPNDFPIQITDNDDIIYGNYLPSQWKLKFSEKDRIHLDILIDEVTENLIHKLGQDFLGLRHLLRIYLFHNELDIEILYKSANRENMASIADSIKEFEEYGFHPAVTEKYFKNKNKNYPIVVRLNAYTTKEHFLSFIKNNWESIKKIQQEYKVSGVTIGKLRNRKQNTNEINLYIAENYSKKGYDLIDEIEEKFNVKISLAQISARKNLIKKK